MNSNFIRKAINVIVKFHKTSYTIKQDKDAASYGSRPVMIYADLPK